MAHNSSPRLNVPLPRDLDSREQTDATPSLTDWVETLSAHGDGELSAGLALDLVLHDLVKKIVHATRATGGAFAMQQDGEFVCRASVGETAPGLGIRIDQHSGLSALCIKSQKWVLCEDTRNDARVDAALGAELGIRSVLIFPVLRDGLMGVIEILSAQPKAFSDRDVETLRRFSDEIADSVNQAFAVQRTRVPAKEPHDLESATPDKVSIVNEESPAPSGDMVTTALTYVVVALALILGWIVGRAGWRAATTKSVAGSRNAVAGRARATPAVSSNTPSPSPVSSSPLATSTPQDSDDLVVYQDGKRIYPQSPSTKRSTDTFKVSPQIADEYVVERFEPEYPEQARQQGIQGPVILNVVVGADGVVKSLEVVSGNSQLAAAACDAVQRWRFQPFLRNGQPQEFSTQVTIDFRLPKQP